MINGYSAFGQNFLKVTIGNRISYVKEHRVHNDAFGEMCAFEIDRHPLPLHSSPT
ncbi:hypothetical protein CES85_5273 [Ochrobactrum quorumnocens]|uniref:Uncharacterized protein n=1 Tax=Ochrobactrum quorumnocens TaxID=271865 RepID=A0A248UDT4_9HYPH|nr:hypothetical protein CES85_5273 [[Ochrobactrum] quorumnocens]